MKRLVAHADPAVVIDVGANVGQSVGEFKRILPSAVIHSFEPSPLVFKELERRTGHFPGVSLNNVALGARIETKSFLENSRSTMSSFLALGKDGWGEIDRKIDVEVQTLDGYARENSLAAIEILKTDTQGFDLEVLKGARGLMAENRIHLVYTELIFSDLYRDIPPVDEFLRFMREHGFQLVSFYRFYHQNNRASWSDGLFLNPDYAPDHFSAP